MTIDEDDFPSVTVSDRSLTVREGGSNTYTVVLALQIPEGQTRRSYTVVLNSPPSANVTVSVSKSFFGRLVFSADGGMST